MQLLMYVKTGREQLEKRLIQREAQNRTVPGFGVAAIIIMQIQICAISLSECCYFLQTFITTFSTPFFG